MADAWATQAAAVNIALWAAFAVDYVVRVLLAPDRRAHFRTHLADLAAVVVPVFRPLRLVRIIGLLGTASRRAGERQLAATAAYVVTGVVLLLVIAAGFVLDAERGAKDANITNAQDALWWAATTVSTVGYGDRFPVTGEGRLAAVALMVGGIALLGVITASVAAWFVRRFSTVEAEVAEDTRELALVLADVTARLERIQRALERR
jgi:voltage-gated potassium channel